MSKTWKQSLLSSGLPLEYEVKRYLESKGCIADFEYSYLRPNETNIERQFSYDVDAAYIKDEHFVTFMIECKYRHSSTQWVFTPETYGGTHELGANDFMHVIDHFVPNVFPFHGWFPRCLAPACSKGIELGTSGDNDKSINQAVAQLAYAFALKIGDAIEHQVQRLLVRDVIFYHVPIIVTTANLFRLREDASVGDIEAANVIEEVATAQSCLVMNYKTGVELRRHNEQVLYSVKERLGEAALCKALNSTFKDIDHLLAVLADHYAPRAIVVMNPTVGAFDHLFSYVDELLTPSENLLAAIKTQREESQKRFQEWQAKTGFMVESRSES